MNKRTLVNAGLYGLAVGLLAYVVYTNWSPPGGKGLGYVWQHHVVEGQPIALGFLAAAIALYSAALLLTLLRWYILVRAVELPFRIPDSLRLGLVGVFFNTFLPGSVGGDVVKAAALASEQSRRTVAVATVIMDRVIALWALFWFVALLGGGLWLTGLLEVEGAAAERSKTIVTVAASVVGASVLVWLLMGLLPDRRAERFAGRLQRLPGVGGSAAEFWRAVWMYRRKQKSVAAVMGISWVGHVGFVLAFWCSAQVLWSEELGPIPSLTQHFLLVPIGLVMQALVPTPGGAGGGEWGFGKLYALFGAAESNGVLGSLVQRVIMWTLGLVGLLVYLRMSAAKPAAQRLDRAAPDANGTALRQPEPEATSAG